MSNVIAGPKLRVLSYSQRHTWSECPEQWRLAKLARDPQGRRLKSLTAAWFDDGTAGHFALEQWELSGRTIDAVSVFEAEYDRLIAAHLQTHPHDWEWVRGGWGKTREADIAARRKRGAENVAAFVEWAQSQPWRVWTLPDGAPALELGFHIQLGGVVVRGFIDTIWEWDDGGIEPVDYKFGSRVPDTDEQLGLYKHVIETCCGATVRGGRFFMMRTMKYPLKTLDEYTPERLAELYRSTDEGMSASLASGRFTARPGPSCFTCMMKLHCPVAG